MSDDDTYTSHASLRRRRRWAVPAAIINLALCMALWIFAIVSGDKRYGQVGAVLLISLAVFTVSLIDFSNW